MVLGITPEKGFFEKKAAEFKGVGESILNNDLPNAVNKAFKGVLSGSSKKNKEPENNGVVTGPLEEDSALDATWPNMANVLFAQFFVCDKDGKQLVPPVAVSGGNAGAANPRADSTVIKAPISDVNIEFVLNWHSQFENMNMDSFKPSLMAMLQSGELANMTQALAAIGESVAGTGLISDLLQQGSGKITDLARTVEGKTGITKLNSRQVFAGMPPVKITMMVHFRAFSDAKLEVEQPIAKLLQWALPFKLAESSISGGDALSALFPSDAPQMIGMLYGGKRYAPLLIEGVSYPLDGPMDYNGKSVSKVVQLTVGTLTAFDYETYKLMTDKNII